MNNAQFKILCFRNGFFSPEQFFQYYQENYSENSKFNVRDVQLWMNGKGKFNYNIHESALTLIQKINQKKNEILETERQRYAVGSDPRYKLAFKEELNLWTHHTEFHGLPINFYNSVLIELGVMPSKYYEIIGDKPKNFSP